MLDTYTLRPDLRLRLVDDELVVYDPVQDRTTLVTGAAMVMVSLCDGRFTLAGIQAEMCAQVPGVAHVAADVERVLRGLEAAGLFVSPAPVATPAVAERPAER